MHEQSSRSSTPFAIRTSLALTCQTIISKQSHIVQPLPRIFSKLKSSVNARKLTNSPLQRNTTIPIKTSTVRHESIHQTSTNPKNSRKPNPTDVNRFPAKRLIDRSTIPREHRDTSFENNVESTIGRPFVSRTAQPRAESRRNTYRSTDTSPKHSSSIERVVTSVQGPGRCVQPRKPIPRPALADIDNGVGSRGHIELHWPIYHPSSRPRAASCEPVRARAQYDLSGRHGFIHNHHWDPRVHANTAARGKKLTTGWLGTAGPEQRDRGDREKSARQRNDGQQLKKKRARSWEGGCRGSTVNRAYELKSRSPSNQCLGRANRLRGTGPRRRAAN